MTQQAVNEAKKLVTSELDEADRQVIERWAAFRRTMEPKLATKSTSGALHKLYVALKYGTAHSGNWGHAGRPGIRGGSGAGTGGLASLGLKPGATVAQRRERSQTVREIVRDNQDRPFNPRDVADFPEWLQIRLARNPAPDNSSLKGVSGKKSKLFKENLDIVGTVTQRGDKFNGGTSEWGKVELETRLDELVAAGGTHAGVANYIVAMAEYEDEATGYNFSNIKFYTDPMGLETVSAHIVDSEGRKIGTLDRRFDYDSKTVYHEYMKITDYDARDTGFGSRFYHESEQAYKQAGFETVEIHANMQVGGYAWARMGYDTDANTFGDFTYTLNQEYKANYGQSIPPETFAKVQ